MLTPLLLTLCLVAACSSKSSKEAPPATAPEAGTPAADPREQACRNNGDGAVCMTAAEHMARRHEDIARELYALACARGAAAGCAANAEPSRTPSLWHGKACRRGLAESCAMTDEWAAALRGRATGDGDLPDWLATEYLRAVEDCAAELPRTEREGDGEVSFTITAAAAAVTDARPPSLRACLERAIALTRRPTSGSHRLTVSLAAAD